MTIGERPTKKNIESLDLTRKVNILRLWSGIFFTSFIFVQFRSAARERACDMAVDILSENCYKISLKNKFTSDGTEVDIIDVQDNTKVDTNIDW